jgi:hypothetical protein
MQDRKDDFVVSDAVTDLEQAFPPKDLLALELLFAPPRRILSLPRRRLADSAPELLQPLAIPEGDLRAPGTRRQNVREDATG